MATQLEGFRSNTAALWLRFVSWLFKLGGSIFVLAALFSLAPVLMRLPQNSDQPSYWTTFLITSAFGVALIGIGMLLTRRSRVGAVLGLVVTLYPMAFVLNGERTLHWSDIVISVAFVAVIASIWPQLSWQTRPTRFS